MSTNGNAPRAPEKLSRGEWIAVLKRAAGSFMKDDCMGLAQEVAYSAMLAFFPAVAFFLGLLGVLGLYDQLQAFLATVAPHGVIHFIEGLQQDQKGNADVVALVVGGVGAVWAASPSQSGSARAARARPRARTGRA